MVDLPPLRPLHPDSSLNPSKLEKLERSSTEALLKSLIPGVSDSLKARPDGTILDGHHPGLHFAPKKDSCRHPAPRYRDQGLGWETNLVLVHCRQGIGRSGLVAARLLAKKGTSPGAAIEMVSAARGLAVPETAEQREWIDRYAATLSVLR